MKHIIFALAIVISGSLTAQVSDLLRSTQDLEAINVKYGEVQYQGKKAIKVSPQQVNSEAKFVKINDLEFQNGTIEIHVAGKRATDAGQAARGFVGIAFRIHEDNSKFECFYIRPTNGRAEDQLRRNHSIQYISFPDHPWHKLRKETPGKYETYADLVEGKWTHIKITVDGEKAKIYIDGANQPTMLVNDLKHGTNATGKIGLWVGPGTEAYFSDLKITTY